MHASIDPSEDAATTSPEAPPRLSEVRSWGYQLQKFDPKQIARSRFDLVVLDLSLVEKRNAEGARKLLAQLQRKADGSRRIALSYLSIGEAENYRPYWRQGWVQPASLAIPAAAAGASNVAALAVGGRTDHRVTAKPFRLPLAPTRDAPGWLGPENAEWQGNFQVRYWQAEWQALLFGSPDALLDRIIAAGFDGVYLDRADAFSYWAQGNAEAKTQMVQLIERLSSYARQKSSGFSIVMQNAEELLEIPGLTGHLDAIAKEDLFFGLDGDGRANSGDAIEWSLSHLRQARARGLPVLLVEYGVDGQQRSKVRPQIEKEGLVPYFGSRLLNELTDLKDGA